MKKPRRTFPLLIGVLLGLFALTCVGLWLFVSPYALREYDDHWKGSNSFEDPAAVAQTKQRGDRIIDALNQYHTLHGSYPGRLDDLAPQFMSEIPKPTAGYGVWEYGIYDGGFSLAFGVGRYPIPITFARTIETGTSTVNEL